MNPNDALYAVLLVSSVVGAICTVLLIQHANDRNSPEPRDNVPSLRWTLFWFIVFAVVGGGLHHFGLIYRHQGWWLLFWTSTGMSCVNAVTMIVKAVKNGRARARKFTRFARLGLLLIPLLIVGTGCASSGTIRAAAVDGAFRRVAARHDAYIAKDATLTPTARAVYLQDSQYLRGILDEANKTVTPAAVAQPAK